MQKVDCCSHLVVVGLGEKGEANKESRIDGVCCRYVFLCSFYFLPVIAYLNHFSAWSFPGTAHMSTRGRQLYR